MKLSTNNLKQSFIQSGGTGINSLLGLGFYLLAARSLGVASFGYFSFLLGFSLLASELGDLGFNSALIKFGSSEKFSAIFTLAALERIFVSVVLIFIFLIASTFFDHNLLLSGFVAVSLLLTSLITQSLNSRQAYGTSVLSNLFGNTTRLLLTFLLIKTSQFNAIEAMWVFLFGALITAAFGLISLRQIFKANLIDLNQAKKIWREVFRFNRYIAGSFGLSSLAAKLDIPILYTLAGPVAVGAYSGAQKISSIIPQLIASLETVFSPKLSQGENTKQDFKDYLILSAISAVVLLLFIPVATPIVHFVFGSKYESSIFLFQIFLVGLSIFSLSGPLTSVVLYRFGKSNYHFFGSLGQILISVGLFFLLIPKLGAVGAAVAFVAVQFFNLIYYLFTWQHVHNRS